MKIVLGSAILVLTANMAFAATNVDVRVDLPAPPLPGVRVNIGHPPPPPMVIERETVIIKEKGDRGKHKGHYKNKKHKKNNKHRD